MTSDPATDPPPAIVRPRVARRQTNHGVWLFGVGLAVAAVVLFATLEARRTRVTDSPISRSVGGTGTAFAPPPDLVIPQQADPDRDSTWQTQSRPDGFGGFDPSLLPPLAPIPVQRPTPGFDSSDQKSRTSGRFSTSNNGGQVLSELSSGLPVILRRPQQATDSGSRPPADSGPKIVTRLSNPSTTVMKGTVIHAVLETALNSTRAGAARAIVSRQVTSFDGTRVVIPKGSKLIGEYEADLALGQNRALINWHRLVLPDGWIVEIDSPSADALGRAGVKGKVDTHFFTRFGGAILQSVLDLGVQVAARKASGDTVIVGLPTAAENPIGKPEDVKPTLKVRQGSSVTVFVARDLDFADVVR